MLFRSVSQSRYAGETAPRDGKFVEYIGNYVPQRGIESLTLKRDRLEYWLSCGALMSPSVKNRVQLAARKLAASTPPPAKNTASAKKEA